MILLLDTATPVCRLVLVEGEWRHEAEWEAHRELAKGLLGFIESALQRQGKDFSDVTGLGVFRGPGSFTGLRIGITVFNTLADALTVPIVGEEGDAWEQKTLARLQRGENDQIVLPSYGSEATITSPRK